MTEWELPENDFGELGRPLHRSVCNGSYEDLFVARKVYRMIIICTNLNEMECECYECKDCKTLRSLSEKINSIRQHPDYGSTLDWTLRNGASVEGFKTLMEEVFTEKEQGSIKNSYRALTLLVCTFDVCAGIKDNDLKRDILIAVDNCVSRQNIDWTVLLNDDDRHYPTRWDIFKTISVKCCTFLLNCYAYYLITS